jgi:voltage-gated potassium channel
MFGLSQKIKSRLKNSIIWGLVLLVISFGAALLLPIVEAGNKTQGLQTLGDLYWWWVGTVTGIGASAEPHTPEGRIIATFIIIVGLVLLGLFISEFSAILRMLYSRREDGNIKIRYRDHIVIFGYTSLTAGVVKLLRAQLGESPRIVLISNEINTNPFPGYVDFLQANPISKNTLYDANIANAAAVIILANDRFRDPDTYSLVISAGTAQINSDVISIVEITDQSRRELFKRTNVDGFIERDEMLEDLLDGNPEPKLIRIISKQTHMDARRGDNKRDLL